MPAGEVKPGHYECVSHQLAVDEAIRRGFIARGEIDRMPHDKLQRSLRELAEQPA